VLTGWVADPAKSRSRGESGADQRCKRYLSCHLLPEAGRDPIALREKWRTWRRVITVLNT